MFGGLDEPIHWIGGMVIAPCSALFSTMFSAGLTWVKTSHSWWENHNPYTSIYIFLGLCLCGSKIMWIFMNSPALAPVQWPWLQLLKLCIVLCSKCSVLAWAPQMVEWLQKMSSPFVVHKLHLTYRHILNDCSTVVIFDGPVPQRLDSNSKMRTGPDWSKSSKVASRRLVRGSSGQVHDDNLNKVANEFTLKAAARSWRWSTNKWLIPESIRILWVHMSPI